MLSDRCGTELLHANQALIFLSVSMHKMMDMYTHVFVRTLLGPEGEEEEAAVDWSGASFSGQDSVRLVSFLKTASQVNCT